MTLLPFRWRVTVVIPMLTLMGCTEMILDLKDTTNLKTEIATSDASTELKISGLVFHSSLGVKEIRHESGVGTITILVSLAPASDTRSGRFSDSVLLTPDITTVRFGSKKEVIWQR